MGDNRLNCARGIDAKRPSLMLVSKLWLAPSISELGAAHLRMSHGARAVCDNFLLTCVCFLKHTLVL